MMGSSSSSSGGNSGSIGRDRVMPFTLPPFPWMSLFLYGLMSAHDVQMWTRKWSNIWRCVLQNRNSQFCSLGYNCSFIANKQLSTFSFAYLIFAGFSLSLFLSLFLSVCLLHTRCPGFVWLMTVDYNAYTNGLAMPSQIKHIHARTPSTYNTLLPYNWRLWCVSMKLDVM